MSAHQNMEDDTAVVGLAEDAADVGKDANDEIVADSDEDSGGSDEDVPDAPEDDYESDGEGQEWSLGFCVEAPADELQRQFFPSKVGGRPAWLDPVDVPTALQLKCLYTREPLDFLLQVYAPVNDDDPNAFHRTVFLFVSPHGGDLHRPGAVRAFRSQLPRCNPFYPDEPVEPGDPLQELTDAQQTAYDARDDRWSDAALKGAIARRPRMFPERELAVEPEEFLDDEKVMAGIVGEKAAEKLAMNAPAEEGSDAWKAQVKAANETLPETLRGVGDDVSEAEVRSLERKQDKNQVQLSRFHLRLTRTDNTQVLRYCFDEGARPLWPSVSYAPEHTSATVPPCARCGAARRFEFQVLPTLVNHLDVDSELNSAIDFGSIAVYTCSRSCAPAASDGTRGMNADGKSEAYAEECVLVHPPLNA